MTDGVLVYFIWMLITFANGHTLNIAVPVEYDRDQLETCKQDAAKVASGFKSDGGFTVRFECRQMSSI